MAINFMFAGLCLHALSIVIVNTHRRIVQGDQHKLKTPISYFMYYNNH